MITEDQAIGMLVGTAIGDALGAPLEFIEPENIPDVHEEMTGGGVHDTAPGEWTDDTAMAMAIADAYITQGGFDPAAIMLNFKVWKDTGTYGTRDYVFDIGNTTSKALVEANVYTPYAGSSSDKASGNGSIMRVAPIMIVNHSNTVRAIGEAVAVSLMTHGSRDTVHYISAFVAECMEDFHFSSNQSLLLKTRMPPHGIRGTIMWAYTQAWRSISNGNFEDAVVHAVNRGNDADTVGAVTGMLAGRMFGYSKIPKRWLDKLHQHDHIVDTAKKLYNLYEKSTKTP